MDNIIELIDKLTSEELNDLIVFLSLNYPEETNKANIYKFWTNKLREESSDRLKILICKYSKNENLKSIILGSN